MKQKRAKITIVLVLIVEIVFICEAKEVVRDPFESLIPTDVRPQNIQHTIMSQTIELTQVTIQGIIQSSGIPCAIINGGVYRKGDYVHFNEGHAEVLDIRENAVFILYAEKVFKRIVTK